MTDRTLPLQDLLARLSDTAAACGRPAPALLAVSKTRDSDEIRALRAGGQRAFGENYVQEALGKMRELDGIGIEWHLIGHLQSNKAEAAATHFDWVQSVDRPKLVDALARHRPADRQPLNVLIQVNIDDEQSKHGCSPDQVLPLAAAIAAQPALRLRGLMAIPAPHPESALRQAAFARMAALMQTLQQTHPAADTLSMGMSGDYAQAIAHGATMVRIGTALFGSRPPRQHP